MKKQLLAAVTAVALCASAAAGAQPMQHGQWDDGHREGVNNRGCYNGERYNDCSQRRSVERRSHHHYVWRDGRYQDGDATGAAVAGGFLGFILGTAIAGSNDDRVYYNSHHNDRG